MNKIPSRRIIKIVRLFVLADTTAAIFSGGFGPAASSALGVVIPDAHAICYVGCGTQTPEMPVELVPMLLIMTCLSVYYLRKRAFAKYLPQPPG
jgi:hypothetical protein